MSPIVSILLGAAAKVGAPIVKSILEKHVGGTAGELGSVVIDAIAEKAGVPAGELQAVPAPQLEQAVAAVEAETPELVTAWNAQQREANRLMIEEMKKETPFGWLWRPAGMWLMLGLVAWYAAIVPLLNTLLAALGARQGITLVIGWPDFFQVFLTFVGLYMGGNTVLRGAAALRSKE
ncbi:3TM-type holin [Shinella zoogloeoides]|uniref:3TM-type holin n=1 Tax=Shinella zoogloeoides TaxID=352475 RepID=UPI0028AB26C4|nr:3TM-type holin [Shinella zoogloeoides]